MCWLETLQALITENLQNYTESWPRCCHVYLLLKISAPDKWKIRTSFQREFTSKVFMSWILMYIGQILSNLKKQVRNTSCPISLPHFLPGSFQSFNWKSLIFMMLILWWSLSIMYCIFSCLWNPDFHERSAGLPWDRDGCDAYFQSLHIQPLPDSIPKVHHEFGFWGLKEQKDNLCIQIRLTPDFSPFPHLYIFQSKTRDLKTLHDNAMLLRLTYLFNPANLKIVGTECLHIPSIC